MIISYNNSNINLKTTIFISSSYIYDDKSKSCDSALEVFLKNKNLYAEVNRFTRYISTVENYVTADPLGIY
jgi:hypothetical protein